MSIIYQIIINILISNYAKNLISLLIQQGYQVNIGNSKIKKIYAIDI